MFKSFTAKLPFTVSSGQVVVLCPGIDRYIYIYIHIGMLPLPVTVENEGSQRSLTKNVKIRMVIVTDNGEHPIQL